MGGKRPYLASSTVGRASAISLGLLKSWRHNREEGEKVGVGALPQALEGKEGAKRGKKRGWVKLPN